MNVSVKFFGPVAEAAGAREIDLKLVSGLDVCQVLDELSLRYPRLTRYRQVLRTAVNLEYVDLSTRLNDGDEIALIPPVSGG